MSTGGKRLILVNADITSRLKLRELFKSAKIVVSEAGDEIGLFNTLTEYGKIADLVVIDLDNIYSDGFHLIKKMQEIAKYKNVPTVILTNRLDKESVITAKSLNVSHYISKTCSEEDLLARIKRILDAS